MANTVKFLVDSIRKDKETGYLSVEDKSAYTEELHNLLSKSAKSWLAENTDKFKELQNSILSEIVKDASVVKAVRAFNTAEVMNLDITGYSKLKSFIKSFSAYIDRLENDFTATMFGSNDDIEDTLKENFIRRITACYLLFGSYSIELL